MHFIDETDPAHTSHISHININKHDNFEGLFSVKKERDLSLLDPQKTPKHSNLSVFTRAARGPTPRRETRYCFISSLLICAFLKKRKQNKKQANDDFIFTSLSLLTRRKHPFLPRHEIRK